MDNQGSVEPVGEAWKYDQQYHQMSDALGVDKYERDDYETAKKLSYLSDWAGKDPSQVYEKLNTLRKSLGFNTQGKTLVNQLFSHVRLQQDKQRTQPVRATAPQPEKQTPIQKTVSQAVQGTVQNAIGTMVQKALGDKKFIQASVESALKGAIK